ncbi:MAG: tRNA (adenosine(37)-N6)-threonylcarbamoyltransferase complex dimerization subunit type 1 TsaB [Desulfobulbus propionicus]|nr:MAG: tRNA (adenosine(37)-N6)-threonylcarbamoyltransferase complex dimerization subunit type 1 TsaB [Desulfobulbus propionicus]
MDGPLILSIETSAGCGSVALTRGFLRTGFVVAEYTHRPDKTHSRRLLGLVEHLMRTTNTDWPAIDAVSVSLGPGSFTGLRIGLAAAKGLALAAGAPLLGIPTLEALAWQCYGTERPICCLLDARKGQVYAARYSFENDRLKSRGETRAVYPQELAGEIDEPTLGVGPGIQAYPEIFLHHQCIQCIPQGGAYPRASMVGFLGARQLMDNAVAPPETLVPFYVRPSEAQINRAKKRKAATGK